MVYLQMGHPGPHRTNSMIPQSLQLQLEGNSDLSITIEYCDGWRIFLFDMSISIEDHVELVEDMDLPTALNMLADRAVKYA